MGFDSAHRQMTNVRYVRVAAGRDSRDAAPVRAVLHGGLAQPLEVNVNPGHSAAKPVVPSPLDTDVARQC